MRCPFFCYMSLPPSLPPSSLCPSLLQSLPASLPSFLPPAVYIVLLLALCFSLALLFLPVSEEADFHLSSFLATFCNKPYMYLHVAYVKLLVCITCRPSAGPIANHSQTACLTLIPMSAVTAPPSQDVDRPMDVQDLHWRPSNTCPSLDFGAARPLNSAQ